MGSQGSPRKVLITGAGSGIGRSTALVFASHGHELTLTTFPGDKRLKNVTDEIKDRFGLRCTELYFDLGDESQCRKVVERDLFSNIDILVNNADLARGLQSLLSSDPLAWSKMIDVNVKGILYMTKAVSTGMIARNSGHIVLLGSILGRHPAKGEGAYASTKAAVYALAEGMRMDLFKTNIRVTVLAPGMVRTGPAPYYEGYTPLEPIDVAQAIWWAVNCPQRVNVHEIVMTSKDQYGPGLVKRDHEYPK